jgi:hypothetical protein
MESHKYVEPEGNEPVISSPGAGVVCSSREVLARTGTVEGGLNFLGLEGIYVDENGYVLIRLNLF